MVYSGGTRPTPDVGPAAQVLAACGSPLLWPASGNDIDDMGGSRDLSGENSAVGGGE